MPRVAFRQLRPVAACVLVGCVAGGCVVNPEHADATRPSDAAAPQASAKDSAALGFGGVPVFHTDAGTCSADSLDGFERKVAPLFANNANAVPADPENGASAQVTSCSQCHLPGIDLSLFARDTPCETYACLLQQGLTDPFHPEQSKVLSWIGRAKPESELITEQVIADEYNAMAQWLEHVPGCNTCAGAKCPTQHSLCSDSASDANTDIEKTDPGDCSDRTLELVFRKTVYDLKGRCSPCHFDTYHDPETPTWIWVSDGCQLGSLQTLHQVEKAGYVNTQQPAQSLLLLKPLAESAGGLPHGGGDKFDDVEDPGYVSFKYFIDRYAACYNSH